jgi:hypothetical protein
MSKSPVMGKNFKLVRYHHFVISFWSKPSEFNGKLKGRAGQHLDMNMFYSRLMNVMTVLGLVQMSGFGLLKQLANQVHF